MRLLIAIGANINQSKKDDYTDSPIYLAVDTRSKEMVQCLLEVGVDSTKQLQAALKLAREHHLDDIIGLLLCAISLDKDRRVLNLSGLQLLEIKPAWVRPSLGLAPREDVRGRRKSGHQRTNSWDNVLDRIKSKTMPTPPGEVGEKVTSSEEKKESSQDLSPKPMYRKQSVPARVTREESESPVNKGRRGSLGFSFLQESTSSTGGLSISEFAAAAIDSIRLPFKRERHTRPSSRPLSRSPRSSLDTLSPPEKISSRETSLLPEISPPVLIQPPTEEEEEVTSSEGQDEVDTSILKERSATVIGLLVKKESDSSDEEAHGHSPKRRHQSLALKTVTGAQHCNFSAIDEIKKRGRDTTINKGPIRFNIGRSSRQISQLLSPQLSREEKISPVSPRMVRRAAIKSTVAKKKHKFALKKRKVESSSSGVSSDDGSDEQKFGSALNSASSSSSSSLNKKSADETDYSNPQSHRRLPRNVSSTSSIVLEPELSLLALDISSNNLSSLSSLLQDGPGIAMKLSSLRILDGKQNKLEQLPRGLFRVSNTKTLAPHLLLLLIHICSYFRSWVSCVDLFSAKICFQCFHPKPLSLLHSLTLISLEIRSHSNS